MYRISRVNYTRLIYAPRIYFLKLYQGHNPSLCLDYIRKMCQHCLRIWVLGPYVQHSSIQITYCPAAGESFTTF